MSFLTEHVHRNRVAAVESMTVLAGASSACAIARDGGSFPAYKFHEGRAAALGALARGLRRGAPAVQGPSLPLSAPVVPAARLSARLARP
ncbi:MAG: hypothetical protein LC679_16170 [Intrasporangiaceae bacterium]|nr:hypothetical protein [Intrasporangiaceae bacterium]